MVVHYPRTVWKNSYAEHEVTGKIYNLKKKKKKDLTLKTYFLLSLASKIIEKIVHKRLLDYLES